MLGHTPIHLSTCQELRDWIAFMSNSHWWMAGFGFQSQKSSEMRMKGTKGGKKKSVKANIGKEDFEEHRAGPEIHPEEGHDIKQGIDVFLLKYWRVLIFYPKGLQGDSEMWIEFGFPSLENIIKVCIPWGQPEVSPGQCQGWEAVSHQAALIHSSQSSSTRNIKKYLCGKLLLYFLSLSHTDERRYCFSVEIRTCSKQLFCAYVFKSRTIKLPIYWRKPSPFINIFPAANVHWLWMVWSRGTGTPCTGVRALIKSLRENWMRIHSKPLMTKHVYDLI